MCHWQCLTSDRRTISQIPSVSRTLAGITESLSMRSSSDSNWCLIDETFEPSKGYANHWLDAARYVLILMGEFSNYIFNCHKCLYKHIFDTLKTVLRRCTSKNILLVQLISCFCYSFSKTFPGLQNQTLASILTIVLLVVDSLLRWFSVC